METPQIEQQDLMLLDKFQASLLEKIMKETSVISDKVLKKKLFILILFKL